MAAFKRIRSRKRHTSLMRFPEVKGKTVEGVEIDPELTAITILFEDKTALSFDLDPALVVFPELASLKSGNWRSLKKWPALRSRTSMVKWR